MPSRDVRDVPRVPALVRAARGEPVRGRKVTRLIGKVSTICCHLGIHVPTFSWTAAYVCVPHAARQCFVTFGTHSNVVDRLTLVGSAPV